MDKFYQLLRESVIVQAVVTLSLVSACIYLSIAGKPIPELLTNATMLSLGFYFGAKSAQTTVALAKR